MDDHARLRIRVRRAPQRARDDRRSIYRVHARGPVAHISFVDHEQPYRVPTPYARAGDEVLIHGSSASRMTRLLGSGAPACLTVTILDGLALTCPAFEHDAITDSVVILGSFRAVTDPARKLATLEPFLEALVPGRSREVCAPSRPQLKATAVLALRISEASTQTPPGLPHDDSPSGGSANTWAGVVPVLTSYGMSPAGRAVRLKGDNRHRETQRVTGPVKPGDVDV